MSAERESTTVFKSTRDATHLVVHKASKFRRAWDTADEEAAFVELCEALDALKVDVDSYAPEGGWPPLLPKLLNQMDRDEGSHD